MIVVDASVLLDAITDPKAQDDSISVLEQAGPLWAPHLIDLEVTNGLRKMLLSSRIDNDQAEAALAILKDLPLTRVDVLNFIDQVWSLRDNFTAYDAAYVALAMTLDAPLFTRDERLASHAKRHVRLA